MEKFLSNLKSPRGANKKKKRLGRGDSSGHGGTSTKGHKGQRSRSGGYHKLGFEGGQMPLARRVPKRGFTNIFRKEYSEVNLCDLAQFSAGSKIDPTFLNEHGIVRRRHQPIKVLGNGEITVGLTVQAHAFTKSAILKIEKAGGKVEQIKMSTGKQ